MREQPLVSVFIPYYNDEKFLRQSVESVLNQTYPNWELILFNHASTDNSRNIAHSYKDKRIKHIDVSENLGAGSGLNLWNSLQHIKGEYVKVFCADDVMYANHLEVLVKYLELNKDKDFVISASADYIDENDKVLSRMSSNKFLFKGKEPFEWQVINSYFNAFAHIVWGGGLVRKSALKNVYKDNSMIYRFDMSFWVALLVEGKKMGCINQSLMQYRKHRESIMFQDYKKIAITCFFEHLPFLDIFYSIKDLNLIKYLCKDVPRSTLQKVHKFDADLVEFLLSLQLFHMVVPKRTFPQPELINLSYKICAYQHLYRLFQNRNSLEKIKTTFGFTIRDFRDMYSSVKELIEKAPKNDELSFAQTIFSIKNSKDRQHKVITILGIRLKFRRKI